MCKLRFLTLPFALAFIFACGPKNNTQDQKADTPPNESTEPAANASKTTETVSLSWSFRQFERPSFGQSVEIVLQIGDKKQVLDTLQSFIEPTNIGKEYMNERPADQPLLPNTRLYATGYDGGEAEFALVEEKDGRFAYYKRYPNEAEGEGYTEWILQKKLSK